MYFIAKTRVRQGNGQRDTSALAEPLQETIRKGPKPHGFYAKMRDDELVDYAKKFIAERGVAGKIELKRADSGLYQALRKRKLIDETELKDKHRDFASMGKDELVVFAKRSIAEKGIIGRKELAEADTGVYQALRGRKLLDEVGLGNLRGEMRDWASMGKKELVAFAKKFIAKTGMARRGELRKADWGLYRALLRKKLLDEVGLGYANEKYRSWATVKNEELIAFAKEFIGGSGIGGRKELEKANRRLYWILGKRKLMDTVFSNIDSSKHKEAVQGVLDAIESFGDDS
jgi:hypothetical protein